MSVRNFVQGQDELFYKTVKLDTVPSMAGPWYALTPRLWLSCVTASLDLHPYVFTFFVVFIFYIAI